MILIRFPWLHFYFSEALFHTPVLPLRNEKQRNIPHFPQRGRLKCEDTSQTISQSGCKLPICQSEYSRSSARSRLFSNPPRPATGSRYGCQYCSAGKRWSAQFTGCFLLFLAGVTQHIKVTSSVCMSKKKNLLRCQLPRFPASVVCYKRFCWLFTVDALHVVANMVPRTLAPVCWRES